MERTIFPAEYDAFRILVRKFIEQEITPNYGEWEEAGIVPREVWLKAGEVGLLCPTVPVEFGGVGGNFLHSAIVIEEMSRAACMAPTFFLQSDIIAPYIINHGTAEQKQRWLPGMVSGDVVASLGMSEPSGGSDLKSMKTEARREDAEYVINGQKTWNTNGHSADLLVLAARTGEVVGGSGISLLLVETDRPGFERGSKLKKIGCLAQDTAELFFSDLRVPVGHLLGEEGQGFYQMMEELPGERLVQAVRAIAAVEAAIEWTIDWSKTREMFGKTLADFQNTQFVLAQHHADALAQRAFVDRCIELHLEGKLDATDAAAAKMVTTQLQGVVMDSCLQLFGGWGYMREMLIGRAFIDARMTRIGGGTIEVMKHIIGRQLVS